METDMFSATGSLLLWQGILHLAPYERVYYQYNMGHSIGVQTGELVTVSCFGVDSG